MGHVCAQAHAGVVLALHCLVMSCGADVLWFGDHSIAQFDDVMWCRFEGGVATALTLLPIMMLPLSPSPPPPASAGATCFLTPTRPLPIH
eukprot:871313-Pelagomonas_calceolata.AAC.5